MIEAEAVASIDAPARGGELEEQDRGNDDQNDFHDGSPPGGQVFLDSGGQRERGIEAIGQVAQRGGEPRAHWRLARRGAQERLAYERGVLGLSAALLDEELELIEGWRVEHRPATVLS